MSEWGPWQEHDGKGCPCAGQWVHVVSDEGTEIEGIAGLRDGACTRAGLPWDASWCWHPAAQKIIRYRIRHPKGMAILEQLLADIPAPVAPEVVQ